MGDDVMTIQRMAEEVAKLGVGNKSSAEIKNQLTQFSNNDFSSLPFSPPKFISKDGMMFGQSPALSHENISPALMSRTAGNALKLMHDDFGDNAREALSKLDSVLSKSKLSNLDFNVLVEQGYAHRLVELYKHNRTAFDHIADTRYEDFQHLNMDIEHAEHPAPFQGNTGKEHPNHKSLPAHTPQQKGRRESLRTGVTAPHPELAARKVTPAAPPATIAANSLKSMKNHAPVAPA